MIEEFNSIKQYLLYNLQNQESLSPKKEGKEKCDSIYSTDYPNKKASFPALKACSDSGPG